MEFYSERRVKCAKKEHKCHICGLTIEIGQTYNRESFVDNNGFASRCTCMPCYRMRDAYLESEDDTLYCNALIQDFVLDDFCKECVEFRKCEYTNKQWSEEPWLCTKVREYYESNYVDKEVET